MQFVKILIHLLLIAYLVGAESEQNSSFTQTQQSWEDKQYLSQKDDYVKRINSKLGLNDMLKQLQKVDTISTSNKQILESIQAVVKTNKFFEVKEYKRTEIPPDIQAIAFYEYLKEVNKKIQYFFQIAQESQEFFQGFEASVRNMIVIVKKIDESLLKIKQDQTIGNQQDQGKNKKPFGPRVMISNKLKLGQSKKQKSKNQKKNNKKVSKQIQFVELNTGVNWQFQEKYDIMIYKDNPFRRVSARNQSETLLYISQSQQTDPLVQKLTAFSNQYQANGKIVNDFLKSLNLKNLDKDVQNDIEKLNQIYGKDRQFFDSIRELDKLITNSLQLISKAQPFLDVASQLIRQIVSLIDKINIIKQNYAYQPDHVYKQLLQLDRDYKTCKGQEKYEIVKDIKIPKTNNLQQVGDQAFIIPPIKQEQCQKNIQNIEENLFNFVKQKILEKIKNEYKIFEDPRQDFFDQNMGYGRGYGSQPWKDRERIFQRYDLQDFDKRFQRYQVNLLELQQNYKPDDPSSVEMYDTLLVLNKKLQQISNLFDSAKQFMPFEKVYDRGEITTKDRFKELDQAIDLLRKNNKLALTVSDYVKEQEIVELLRDYKICQGKEFYEAQKITHIQNKFLIKEKLSSLVEIDQQMIYNNQKKTPQKQKQSTKKSQRVKSLKRSYIQIQQDWKFEEYPPIKKEECKEELNEIKEDILQFKKIQILLQYQKNYQKSQNKVIDDLLGFEDEFLENIKFVRLLMEYTDLERNIISFENIPKSKQQDDPTEIAFESLQKFNKYLLDYKDAYIKAKGLLNLNKDDFSVIRYNQFILNEYLDKQFKYQSDTVEKELKQLYRDYQICTGKQYEQEKADAQKVIHQSFLIKNMMKKTKQNKNDKHKK